MKRNFSILREIPFHSAIHKVLSSARRPTVFLKELSNILMSMNTTSKQEFINRLLENNIGASKEIIHEMDLKGWLYDGSLAQIDLKGLKLRNVTMDYANLSNSNLEKASLGVVSLEGVNLQSANLERASLVNCILTGANLENANLRNASLRYVNFKEAVFRGADLANASLVGAILTGADLQDVNLQGANLNGANLNGANLSNAELNKAQLHQVSMIGTILNGCNFAYASCHQTTFANVNFKGVLGLETVQHSGPSFISIDTLYKSKNAIPDIFLQGCGVPPLLAHSEKSWHDDHLFWLLISYHEKDRSFANHLYQNLQAVGVRCWLNEHQLAASDPTSIGYFDIQPWEHVLICCSQASLTHHWINIEIEDLIQREKDSGRQSLLLVDLDQYLFSKEWNNKVADEIRSKNIIAIPDDNFDEGSKKIRDILAEWI